MGRRIVRGLSSDRVMEAQKRKEAQLRKQQRNENNTDGNRRKEMQGMIREKVYAGIRKEEIIKELNKNYSDFKEYFDGYVQHFIDKKEKEEILRQKKLKEQEDDLER